MSKRILIISPIPSHPSTAGNRIRISNLIEALIRAGHEVWFLHVLKEKGDPEAMRAHWGQRYLTLPYSKKKPGKAARILSRLRRFSDPESAYVHSVDAWYDAALDNELRRLQQVHGFDAVIVEYVYFSRALECFGKNVLKIIDTHGVFTERHRAFLQRNQRPEWYSTTRVEEARGLNRADVVIAIQNQDQAFFKTITDRKVITVGHPVTLNRPEGRRTGSFNLLYMGSSNASNYQSIIYFINEVLPSLRQRIPQIKLLIAGRICERIAADTAILKLGEVDDVSKAYDMADLVINPIQFGTGLKIKSIEAMGQGKPLVTTAVGAEGMEPGRDVAFLVANDTPEFVSKIVELLSDSEYYNAISQAAYDFACRWNRDTLEELAGLMN